MSPCTCVVDSDPTALPANTDVLTKVDMSTGFIFDSLKEASLSLNMADMTLSKMLRGISKNKTTYKYV
jgi:hypothetical protein